MHVESQTDDTLTFAPWDEAKRLRSLFDGIFFMLMGLGAPAVFVLVALTEPSARGLGLGWLGPIAVGVVFPFTGMKYIFHSLPLRLEIQREPVGSCLRWRSRTFQRVRPAAVESILVGVRAGRRRSRYFSLQFCSGNVKTEIFRSFECWWTDRDAVQHADPIAQEIAKFLRCGVELEA